MKDAKVEVEMNSKYIEKLEEVLQLEKSYGKKVQCPAAGRRAMREAKNGKEDLNAEEQHIFRQGVGVLLYLAPDARRFGVAKASESIGKDIRR